MSVQASKSDSVTLTYQWYRNTADSNSGGEIVTGATSASYTPSTATAGTAYYYVIVTNTNNSVNGNKTATAVSDTAEISVIGTSTIVIDLADIDEWDLVEQSAEAEANADKVFTVDGTYMAYQWYLDGDLIGTSSAYTFNEAAGVYELAVVVTNSAGEKQSGSCRVTAVNN